MKSWNLNHHLVVDWFSASITRHHKFLLLLFCGVSFPGDPSCYQRKGTDLGLNEVNTRRTQMIWAVWKMFLTKQMKIVPLNGAYWRSGMTATMTARSANVDISIKWRLNPRKRSACSSSIRRTLRPLFNGSFGESYTKVLHVRIQSISSSRAAILLPCQQSIS